MNLLKWDRPDIILVSGDTYIDSPYFCRNGQKCKTKTEKNNLQIDYQINFIGSKALSLFFIVKCK
ncbi:MAG: hypothetical protein LBI80_01760 [Endomicrobium sp.]|nr:hypothetical protein [Endomicrobium sp.]